MVEKLDDFVRQLEAIDAQLADGQVMADMKRYTALMQERSRIAPIVEELSHLKDLLSQLQEARSMASSEDDPELQEMAKEEVAHLEGEVEHSERNAKMLLIPPDPMAGKNIIMEIRAGTGGDEASLFASDLLRMYSHYAESKRWKMEVMNASESQVGGYKEVVVSIESNMGMTAVLWAYVMPFVVLLGALIVSTTAGASDGLAALTALAATALYFAGLYLCRGRLERKIHFKIHKP